MIVTFGHSTMDLETAKRKLHEEGVAMLIDVRSHPTSNHAPQWQQDNITKVIPNYAWLPELGGWSELVTITQPEYDDAVNRGVTVGQYLGGFFPKHRIGQKRKIPAGQEGWNNWGLYDYSVYMGTGTFREGLERLKQYEGSLGCVAIMCSELLWWKCHRSMVADALVYKYPDEPVFHLQPQATNHKPHAERRAPRYEVDILDAIRKDS